MKEDAKLFEESSLIKGLSMEGANGWCM